MATVTFSNGAKINFEGTPTQSDIEEVSKTPQVVNYQTNPIVQNEPAAKSLIQGVGGAVKSMVEVPGKAAAEVGAIPVQLGARALGQPDPYAQGIPTLTGTMPIAPATPAGFLQKAGSVAQVPLLAASGPMSIGKTALLGGAMALASEAEQGKMGDYLKEGNYAQIARDAAWGSLFGSTVGTLSSFFKYAGAAEQAKTGVVGAMQDAISKTTPEMLTKYIEAGKNHGITLRSLGEQTPVAVMENEFNKRASLLTSKVIPEAGKSVGAAKKSAASLPVTSVVDGNAIRGQEAVLPVIDDVNSAMQEMTGREFSLYQGPETNLQIKNYPQGPTSGTMVLLPGESPIAELPGRAVKLSSSEEKDLQDLGIELYELHNNPTVGRASDALINIDNMIGKWDVKQFGEGNSPVQGVLKWARGAVNRIIAPASPELAAANAEYSRLMDLKKAIATQAGKVGQSAALMMRRVFSGDKSSAVIPVLNELDQTVAPHLGGDSSSLLQHAALGKWATDMFGNESTKQLFAQGVKEGQNLAQEASMPFYRYPSAFIQRTVGGTIRALSPDVEKYAMSVAQRNPLSMNIISRALDKVLVEPGTSKMLDSVSTALRQMGVSAKNLEPVTKSLLKYYFLNQLSQPKPAGFPEQTQSTPNTILPMSVLQSPPQSIAPQGRTLSVAQPAQQAINQLTPATTGQGMSRRLGTANPGGLNLSSNLSLS